ncbi:hypothetical protein ACQPU1_09015 [Clostridium paraputrificum]|uniref:hypothetical protein n=1 Tax=Clostridium TaxID=1485 RepID=UPI003D34FA31
MRIDRKGEKHNTSIYGSKPLAIYQFHGNTKKIPFIPFVLAISKVDALDALDEIESECKYIQVVVLNDFIIFENERNESLWTIESTTEDSTNNLSKGFIDFITTEKDGLNLNFIEDPQRSIIIFRDSNF